MGQPMQILPEQRANQGGRQPLQRSGLPLVTGRRDVREGGEERVRGMNSRGGVRERKHERVREKSKGMSNSTAASVPGISGITFSDPPPGNVVSLSLRQQVTSSPSRF